MKLGIPQDVLREISICSYLDCDQIARPLELYLDEDNNIFKIYYEFYDFDLYKFNNHLKEPLPESSIKFILYKLLQAIAYLHSN